MKGLNRRKTLRGIASFGLVAGGIGSVGQSVTAAKAVTASVNVDDGINTSDSSADAVATVENDDSEDGALHHQYSLFVQADVANTNEDDDSGTDDETYKDEEVVASLHQERRDCSDTSLYWKRVQKTSYSACANRRGNNVTGDVPTEGDGWAATGDYRLKAQAVEYDDYDHDEESVDVDGGDCSYEDDGGWIGEDGDDYSWEEVGGGWESTTFQLTEDVGNCCDLCQSSDL